MKKRIFCVIILFLAFINCKAQSPAWLWAKSGTGQDHKYNFSVCSDSGGNIYTTGFFRGPTITFGSITLTNSVTYWDEAFIAKYDASGNIIWARSASGSGWDQAYDICSDAAGNVYITGYFTSPTITFGSTVLTNVSSGNGDFFLVKYDANGNVIWARSGGGISMECGRGISTDAAGNIYVTGFIGATASFGSATVACAGNYDSFIAKYDANGNAIWAKSAGGSAQDYGYGISTDMNGNSYITGSFFGNTMSIGNFTLTNTGASSYDIFIAKYDMNGNVVWAKSAGGTYSDQSSDIALDNSGSVYITGDYQSNSLAIGTSTLTNVIINPSSEIFIAKYDVNGNPLWARGPHGTDNDISSSVYIDASGNAYITGEFGSNSLSFGTSALTLSNLFDVFVAKYDSSGNVAWTQKTSGNGLEQAYGICGSEGGSVIVAGRFESTNAAFGTNTLSCAGLYDSFVAKIAGTTGIHELSMKEDILVYPNPNSGLFNVQCDIIDGELSIINILGQNVFNQSLSKGVNFVNTVSLTKGIYYYSVTQNKSQTRTGKLIIE